MGVEETKDHLITQYEVKEQTGLVESEENDAGHSFNATALYSPLSYLPQSLGIAAARLFTCLLYTSPSPRDTR